MPFVTVQGARRAECGTGHTSAVSLRRAALSAAAAALVVPLLAIPGAGAATDAAGWHRWSGSATQVERTGQYSRGELVYTNGLWKALGADADGLARTDYYAAFKPSPADPTAATFDLYNALTYDFFGAHRAAHNGDAQLPRDAAAYPDGTADLSEVRLAVEGSRAVRPLPLELLPVAGRPARHPRVRRVRGERAPVAGERPAGLGPRHRADGLGDGRVAHHGGRRGHPGRRCGPATTSPRPGCRSRRSRPAPGR